MRKIISLCIIIIAILSHLQQGYSQEKEAIIDDYLSSLPPVADTLIKACDYLISLSEDNLVKSSIAGYLFNHFITSHIMGYETVAVYIAKNYFLNNKLEWSGKGGLQMLQFYVEFNENSLIGMQAPQLSLYEYNNAPLSLYSLQSRYTLIYFFDNECDICREFTPQLREVVKEYDYLNISVYAVFSKNNIEQLAEYLNDNFKSDGRTKYKNWHFVLDITDDSDFNRKYNVIKTPQLFLLDNKKIIIGRELDIKAVKDLLTAESDKISYYYTEAEAFVPKYLQIFDLSDTNELRDAFEPLFKRLTNDNTEMYNAVFYHLFEHLVIQQDQATRDAAVYLAKNYIFPYKEMWFDKNFTEKRVPQSVKQIMGNRPGEIVSQIKLSNLKGREVNLFPKRVKKQIIFFFDTDCPLCRPFIQDLIKIHKDLKRKKIEIRGVYIGNDTKELTAYLAKERIPWVILSPSTFQKKQLFESLEIIQVPYSYILDKGRKILYKGVYPQKIKELFL